jgi:Protein of unknown function (DUF1360)
MLEQIGQVLVSSATIAVISLIITRSGLFKPIRSSMSRWKLLGELISCPFCTSVWVSMGLAFFIPLLIATQYMGLNYWITVFTNVAVAAPIMGKIFKSIESLEIQ